MSQDIQERPLRIAIARQRYRVDGGAEQFITRILETLAGDRAELTIISRNWKSMEGIKAVICNPPYFGRVMREASFAWCVCRHARKQKYDFLQAHEKIPCADIYRAGDGIHREWLRQRSRTMNPLARLAQWASPFHRYLLWAEKRLIESEQLRVLICNSIMVRDEVLENYRVDPSKIRVIYNGVDSAGFSPKLKRHRDDVRARLGIPGDAFVFLFVGSGFQRKGLPTIMAALARNSLDAHLVVVGHDKQLQKYTREARNYGIGDRVHFEGKQAEVKPYYGAADAFILPALYDPFPNVIWEAMASGLPVITSRKCGGAELVKEGESGYVCDALDVDEIAGRMQDLVNADADADAMGKIAHQTVIPYTSQHMNTNLMKLYTEVLQEGYRKPVNVQK